MVPSKTSQCTLSKSWVVMSLCAVHYHNVLCQNAQVAGSQSWMWQITFWGWGLVFVGADGLTRRLWEGEARKGLGTTENLRGSSPIHWSKTRRTADLVSGEERPSRLVWEIQREAEEVVREPSPRQVWLLQWRGRSGCCETDRGHKVRCRLKPALGL